MARIRYGNPKKKSRFICLSCMKENHVGDGVQRGGKQRERNHIKDLACICTKLEGTTKNLEVRYCDNFQEMMKKAIKKHNELYNDNVTEVVTDFYGTICV